MDFISKFLSLKEKGKTKKKDFLTYQKKNKMLPEIKHIRKIILFLDTNTRTYVNR